jgi:hypothetical protein
VLLIGLVRLSGLVGVLSGLPCLPGTLLLRGGFDGRDFFVVEFAVLVLVELLQRPLGIGGVILADGILFVCINDAVVVLVILGEKLSDALTRGLSLSGGGLDGGEFPIVQLAVSVLVEPLQVPVGIGGVVLADSVLLVLVYDAIMVLVVFGKELGLWAISFCGESGRGDGPTEQAEGEGDNADFLHGVFLSFR